MYFVNFKSVKSDQQKVFRSDTCVSSSLPLLIKKQKQKQKNSSRNIFSWIAAWTPLAAVPSTLMPIHPIYQV